jgi:hypothetical protein
MNRFRLLTVLVALSALSLFTLAGTAHADLLYQFDVHETSTIGVQPFSFSFTAPTFVTFGQSPAFTPFTVDLVSTTFGNHSYKMILDEAGEISGPPRGCFLFETGPGFINPLGCGVGSIGTDGTGSMGLFTLGGLPTATGMQTLSSSTALLGIGGGASISPGLSGTLDITTVTSVPEPASLALLSLGIAAVGWRLRKRRGVAL